jgi:hypothetical protein
MLTTYLFISLLFGPELHPEYDFLLTEPVPHIEYGYPHGIPSVLQLVRSTDA